MKSNLKYYVHNSGDPDPNNGVISDQSVSLTGIVSKSKYSKTLRLVHYHDKELNRKFMFLTNNYQINALTVASLYQSRWGIEIFFKWIKQHLKIKSFWGQSENAVKIQIWTAIACYVIVIIAKKQLKLKHSLYEILQVISLCPFDKTPINRIFEDAFLQEKIQQSCNQLKMF